MSSKPTFISSVLGMQPNLRSCGHKGKLKNDLGQDLVENNPKKALYNEDKFVDNANFKGWMLTIMRNIFINNYRKNVRENTMVDTSDDLYQLNLTQETVSDTPDGAYAVNEISEILKGFPADYREPFSLHVAGYKYEEIAEVLSMPLGTVKSRIFFTRKRLREILKDYR